MLSLDWFLTVPGILISCGVILLIIVIIMFIVSGSKKRPVDVVMPENKEESNIEKAVETVVPVSGVETVDQVIPDAVDVNVGGEMPEVNISSEETTLVEPVTSPVENTEVSMVEPVATEEIKTEDAPVVVEEPKKSFIPDFDNTLPMPGEVNEEVIVPSFEGDNIIPENQENVNNDIKENMFVPNVSEPVVEEENKEISFEIPDPIPTPVAEEQKIEEPVAKVDLGNINIEPEEPKPIYGGANPLDATQNLPKMDVHHEPYSGGLKEVSLVEPIESVKEDSKLIIEEPVAVSDESQIVSPIETPVVEESSVDATEVEEKPKPIENTQIITLPTDEVEEL